MTVRKEACPICGADSKNKHDPIGAPTLLKCSEDESHVWIPVRGA